MTFRHHIYILLLFIAIGCKETPNKAIAEDVATSEKDERINTQLLPSVEAALAKEGPDEYRGFPSSFSGASPVEIVSSPQGVSAEEEVHAFTEKLKSTGYASQEASIAADALIKKYTGTPMATFVVQELAFNQAKFLLRQPQSDAMAMAMQQQLATLIAEKCGNAKLMAALLIHSRKVTPADTWQHRKQEIILLAQKTNKRFQQNASPAVANSKMQPNSAKLENHLKVWGAKIQVDTDSTLQVLQTL